MLVGSGRLELKYDRTADDAKFTVKQSSQGHLQ